MASLNINSLLAHIDELRIWSEDQTFDLLAINESKLDDKINSAAVSYELLRKDRNRSGGDVAIFVRNSLNYLNRSNLVPPDMEALCLAEIFKPNSKPFAVLACYRPPNSKSNEFLTCFENIVQILDIEGKDLYVMGDLNLNNFLHNVHSPSSQLGTIC